MRFAKIVEPCLKNSGLILLGVFLIDKKCGYTIKSEIHKLYKPILLISNMVHGKVIQFRQGRHSITPRHFLIEVDGVADRAKAGKLVGKEVTWKSPAGKIITGKVSAPHGGKGLVRAIFEIGLPGQALNTEVEIK